MPGVISESYTAPHLDVPSYDQIVAFGRYLASEKDFNVDSLLEYFESPWKWEQEYRTWRRFGVSELED